MMAHLQQQAGSNWGVPDSLTYSSISSDEKSRSIAPHDTTWSETDTSTCASSSSGSGLPITGLLEPSGQAWEKSWGAAHALDCASTKKDFHPTLQQPAFGSRPLEFPAESSRRSGMNWGSVSLGNETTRSMDSGVVEKEPSAESSSLEAYLARQREHLATAICREWIAPGASRDRQMRLRLACEELVRQSFNEVLTAREEERRKSAHRCMRKSTDGPASLNL